MKKLPLFAAMAAAMALSACEASVTEDGEMPSVDVDVSGDAGNLPEVEVETADVEVGSDTVEVEVPDVDVTMPSEK